MALILIRALLESSGGGDVEEESTEKYADSEHNEDISGSGDSIEGQKMIDGAQTVAEYTVQPQQAFAQSHSGDVVVEASYDLVVLEGDNRGNREINAALEQDSQDFLTIGCTVLMKKP